MQCDTPAPNPRIVVRYRGGPCRTCDTQEKRLREQYERRPAERDATEETAQVALECMTIDPSRWPEEYGSLAGFEQGNAQGWASESLIPGERTPDREGGQATEGQNAQAKSIQPASMEETLAAELGLFLRSN